MGKNMKKVIAIQEMIDKVRVCEGRCSFCGSYVVMTVIPNAEIVVEAKEEEGKEVR